MFISNFRVLVLIYIFMIFLSFEFPTLTWAEDELRSLSDTPMARCLSVHPNGMRGNTDHKGCDLTNLRPPHLFKKTDFSGHRFDDADLRGADLTDSSFKNASFKGANLTDATLDNVNFENANLTGANFTDADLTDANLTGAILTGANFSGADLTGLKLGDADIKDVKDLESYIANTPLESHIANTPKDGQDAKKEYISSRLKKIIERYLMLCEKVNEHMENIKNCCENKQLGDISSFIARFQIKNTSKANKWYEKNKEYFEYGEKLMDPLKKESAIDDIAKYEQRTFPKKVRRIRSKLIKEIANLELRVKKDFDREASRYVAQEKLFRERHARDEASRKAMQERIALITNTKLYKKMLAAMEGYLVNNPIMGLKAMELKLSGKSDAEIEGILPSPTLLRDSYVSCLQTEFDNRFPEDQLKSMATEIGTNNMEVVSIKMKCG